MKEERELSKKSLGEYVRDLRLKAGFKNIQAAATAAGVDRAYWSRLEAGKETGSIDSLKQVAEALKVPLATLVNIYADLPANNDLDPESLSLAYQIKGLSHHARAHIHNQLLLLQLIRLEDLKKLSLEPAPALKNHDNKIPPAQHRARDDAKIAEGEEKRTGKRAKPKSKKEAVNNIEEIGKA